MCNKNKKDPQPCIIEICPDIIKENRGLLNPAFELLRILDMDFIHLPKTKTGNRDVLKSNKGHADLLVLLDETMLIIEFKIKGKGLSKEQRDKADRYQLKRYARYDVINDLNNFYCNAISYLSYREELILKSKKKETDKWLKKYNINIKE